MPFRQKATGITVSGFVVPGGTPQRAVSTDDPMLEPEAMAERVLGAALRTNVHLSPVTNSATQWLQNGTAAALGPTTLPEFVVPDLIFDHPGPAIVLAFNRVLLLPFTAVLNGSGLDTDPGNTVPPGEYWVYRAVLSDGSIEQRVRIGTPPSPGGADDIRALMYWIDVSGVNA